MPDLTPAEILARLDARPHGKLEREAAKLIREQQARIAELEADRAEWVEIDRLKLGKQV